MGCNLQNRMGWGQNGARGSNTEYLAIQLCKHKFHMVRIDVIL